MTATLQDRIAINSMQLRNRIALPPLTTNYGNPDGCVTNEIVRFYDERSRDPGLVIVEACAVRADGRILSGSIGLWNRDQISGMRRLAGAIKACGAAAVVQINHAGARGFPAGGELQGASPSGYAFRPDVSPVVMSTSQIHQLVADFQAAAGRAQEAGFDGVEIHGAHLYLISQFLSPITNLRTDRYGGDVRGRASLAIEVVRAVRKEVGAGYPILFRLNAVEQAQGGQTLADALEVSRLLAEAGVDALDVSVVANSHYKEIDGREYLMASSALSKEQAAGANVSLAAAVREATDLPVIAVGKLGENGLAEQTVRETPVDIVAIGRQMIADPESVGKILSGNSSEINACIECMTCFATIGKGKPMACKVNRNLPRPAD